MKNRKQPGENKDMKMARKTKRIRQINSIIQIFNNSSNFKSGLLTNV